MTQTLTFINPETNAQEIGKFVKYVGPFKSQVKSLVTKKTYVIDLDDMWSNDD